MNGLSRTEMSPVDLVTASAGTGKTHRLTRAYLDAVAAGIAPEAILATTFTRKAAAELLERIRGGLFEAGRNEAARDALAGRIGTVNALFGRIAADFALEAGRSPVAEVIADERAAALFAAAADAVILRHGDGVEAAAWRLRLPDWRGLVQEVGAKARLNGIAADDLVLSAERSLAGLFTLLPAAADSGETLDRALADAVSAAVTAIGAAGDTGVKKTAEALAVLKDAAALLDDGRPLPWAEWVRLGKTDAGKRWTAVVDPVREAAGAHLRHPRLRADLRALVEGVFRCAAEAMEAYGRFKRDRGLVDFVDQECEALALLEQPELRDRLAERIELALVDEFQDTSPIQLALFLRLARVVRRSVWVGDAKQAIYGFRGTDPALIDAVTATVPRATGGMTERLPTSWRSRPGLVAFHNDLFGAAFPPLGIAREDATVGGCARKDGADQRPPLALWTLGGKNWDLVLAALARGVATLLALPETWPVGMRGDREGRTRPIRGEDIAILCRKNERCAVAARALAAAGLKVAVGRQGLVSTPEAGLALAALRYLVDPADTLAMVELAHADGDATGGDGQPSWLEDWLRPDDARGAARRAREELEPLRALDAARGRLLHLTPVEALEVAMMAGGVVERVKRWGDAAGRLANLDALRGLARDYEEDCRARRGAATAGGLIGFLSDVDKGGDQPPATDAAAVRVMTYHQAKGLEWPLVIAIDLQDGPDPSPFGLSVEGPADGVDPWNPLAGRWLRWWPWPYEKQRKGTGLDGSADASPEMAAAGAREQAEAVRLLYVGLTRARDYLVLAQSRHGAAWLTAPRDAEGVPVVQLPAADGEPELRVASARHPLTLASFEPPEETDPGSCIDPEASVFTLPAAAPVEHPPLRIAPSRWRPAADAAPAVLAGETRLGERLPTPGGADITRLGEAMHGFLAVDRPDTPAARRLALAAGLLTRWELPGMAAEALVEAGDRLWRALAARWPGAGWRCEVPVQGRLGLQRVSGRIDLLVDAGTGWVILDHKAFPGPHERWAERALEHAPQLALYARLVAEASGRPVLGCFIHMPVVGRLLEVG
ncbi:ATP-dependent exoDNAse (exonuclease V) beta subunit [Azospirillum agricola]|uniref:UvrD-helicase domain-containing protein n=1 Tax=Azospirillum agricola TaxID=1720247 RepID=UPI001AE51B73|nr:UvrD-helicase domain-containing protein [Azospirillum agricola]MBP2230403.1 ATP-dependent exoDNAse (exonuclease V) beta subunit [Azospirillum agricola]